MGTSFQPGNPWQLPLEVKVVSAGLLIGASMLMLVIMLRMPEQADIEDFESAVRHSAHTTISRISLGSPGKHTVLGRPVITIWLQGQEHLARGVDERVYVRPRVGLPVLVEYRVGQSGKVYITKTELSVARDRPRFGDL